MSNSSDFRDRLRCLVAQIADMESHLNDESQADDVDEIEIKLSALEDIVEGINERRMEEDLVEEDEDDDYGSDEPTEGEER